MNDEALAETAPTSRAALVLLGGGAMALVGAGLMMWAAYGPSVFADIVVAAIAWCF